MWTHTHNAWQLHQLVDTQRQKDKTDAHTETERRDTHLHMQTQRQPTHTVRCTHTSANEGCSQSKGGSRIPSLIDDSQAIAVAVCASLLAMLYYHYYYGIADTATSGALWILYKGLVSFKIAKWRVLTLVQWHVGILMSCTLHPDIWTKDKRTPHTILQHSPVQYWTTNELISLGPYSSWLHAAYWNSYQGDIILQRWQLSINCGE